MGAYEGVVQVNRRYNCEIFNSTERNFFYPGKFTFSNEPGKIAFGSNVAEIRCERNPKGKTMISISSTVADELGIPHSVSSLCLFEDNETLYLGPLVGIFSSGFTPYQMTPIGERSPLFARLLSIQSSIGAVPFLFGEEHINWEMGTINAYIYKGKEWEKVTVPFPNIVYDRLPNHRIESTPSVQKVKETLENDYLIPWYNPVFFNKLDLVERLYNDPHADMHLPETLPFTSFSVVERMLSEYGHVFLKHPDGDMRQIIFDQLGRCYYCRYFGDKNRLIKFESIEGLMNNAFEVQELNKMFVQQGIRMIRHEKKPVDFRVYVNKDDSGEWNLSKIVANAAGIDKKLDEIFPEQAKLDEYKTMLGQAAFTLASAIEDNCGGIVGEIMFKLGIDRDGKVWMLDANSIPTPFTFIHPGLKDSNVLTKNLALSFTK